MVRMCKVPVAPRELTQTDSLALVEASVLCDKSSIPKLDLALQTSRTIMLDKQAIVHD